MAFEAYQVLPDVVHIRDAMGVCMTLLLGDRQALLIDAGYGVEDVRAFVRTLTDLPVTLLLTHCHHDHAMGARWFDAPRILAADAEDYARRYTGEAMTLSVWRQARDKGINLPESWRDMFIPAPVTQEPCDIELGGMTARVLAVAGHTPGSAAVYVPERELLLTGDDWNPCTWLFFPEALDVWRYRDNLRGLMALPFRHVLCPHQTALYPREKLEAFVSGLTEECLRAAPPVSIGGWEHIETRQADVTQDQILVFDAAKAGIDEEGGHQA